MVVIFTIAYRVLAGFIPSCKVRGAINLFSSKDLHSAAQSSVAGGLPHSEGVGYIFCALW